MRSFDDTRRYSSTLAARSQHCSMFEEFEDNPEDSIRKDSEKSGQRNEEMEGEGRVLIE